MDFFEHQEVARKRTGVLVFYFGVCVLLIVAGVTAASAGIVSFANAQQGDEPLLLQEPAFYLVVAAGTLGVIVVGSLFKLMQLKTGGGALVAQRLGGRVLDPGTTDPQARKLLNVVEEMAIASGLPIPPVYLMEDETGINAFAAGLTPGTAVIGVTRGCIKHLSRDELQGVMAHEFSHILNGDMQLNIRLMGLLNGILLLAIIGYGIVRSTTHRRAYGYSRRSNKESSGSTAVALGIGAALIAIGYVGVFFGKLIKSAVSRQREFLADASAVQFTRNGDGIAGALKRIGGLSASSTIHSSGAQEASHLFFGNGIGTPWLSGLATHPPLAERIKRIDPSFDGKFEPVRAELEQDQQDQKKPAREKPMKTPSGTPRGLDVADAITNIGTLRAEQLAVAAAIIGSMPQTVVQAAHSGFEAQAVVYALLLDHDEPVRRQQLAMLKAHADTAVYRQTETLTQPVLGLDRGAKTAAAEMAIGALTNLSPQQFEVFETLVKGLVEADKKISLFEFMLQRMVRRHLGVRFGTVVAPTVRYHAVPPVAPAVSVVLSAVAHVGGDTPANTKKSFEHGAHIMATGGESLPFLEPATCGLKAIDQALDVLAQTSPGIKKRLMRACAVTIGSDERVTDNELELLRAVADALDCPMPAVT